ncbi:MAG: hypothetical protein ACOX75_00855 [Lachnospiraceae bacterium]|jgi:hypothetical protein
MNRVFKGVLIFVSVLALCFSFTACDFIKINIDKWRKPSETTSSTLPSETTPSETTTEETTEPPTEAPTEPPTEAPTEPPTEAFTGEDPDRAGFGEVLFDIYKRNALVDLNGDGKPEKLTFRASGDSATMQINSSVYNIDDPNLAQLFAVTDVDVSDGILELVFTAKYPTEFPFAHLYWWDGVNLFKMGSLPDVRIDGPWRNTFFPEDHFDAHGMVMCRAMTQHLSTVWYIGHYIPEGAERRLKEDLYVAEVISYQEVPLKLKEDHMLLLKKITSKYFEPSYSAMWDYGSGSGGYGGKSRSYSDDIVAFIPQKGEGLIITDVYGQKWFKLTASDGKSGWLKCEDSKVYGYWPVMGDEYTAYDLFDGIM